MNAQTPTSTSTQNAPSDQERAELRRLVIPIVAHITLFLLFIGFAAACGMAGGNPGLWLFTVLVNIMFVYIMREADEGPAMVVSVIILAGSCFALIGTVLSFKYSFSAENIGWLVGCAGIAFLIRTLGCLKTANVAITMCGTWFTAFAVSQTIGTSISGYLFEVNLWLVVASCWLQGWKFKPFMAQVGAICSAAPAAYFASAFIRYLYSN